jgi:transglutaminase-like putative cysteine protease
MRALSIKAASLRWLLMLGAMALPLCGQAACDIQITSAGPCLLDSTYGIPHVGDNAYAIKAVINVIGTPTHPFRFKMTLANNTNFSDYINLSNWYGAWWWYVVPMALDGPIPWSVTFDPDGVSGDTNPANNTESGTFNPIPPTNAVELYSPRLFHGYEYYTLAFQPGSGNLNNLWVVFGIPTSHGAQKVISVTSPTNGETIITAPNSVPVFVISRTNVPATTFQDTNYFTAQLNNIRVNPAILQTNTWAGLASMTTNWTKWTAPDQMVQSTNPIIAAFVQQSLPVNYKSVLTPYDTARALHRAVMKQLTYRSPPLHFDAVGVCQDGVADCGGFAHLLAACLRNVGIPARMISGFWQGNTQWHCRTEFHLPNVEWLLADPTFGNGADPTGTYAYYFGFVPNANNYFAVDVGDAHILPYNNFTFLQVPNWWWTGGATYNSYSATTYLQPNGLLTSTNGAGGSTSFFLSDAPTEGSVVIQTSTNLLTWSAVVTNSATGDVINYSFPNNQGPSQFYRAQVSP